LTIADGRGSTWRAAASIFHGRCGVPDRRRRLSALANGAQMANWTVADLEYWDAAIRERVQEFGLDTYPQEFEVCDQNNMLGYMAYHGMPSHYPHWSFGKAYEQTKTMYDYGVTGLPYEMVINSDPCLAYLMRDNSLCLQILTIAQVYGHTHFIKNNFPFTSATRAGETIS
jgi:stage V sporulation protein R